MQEKTSAYYENEYENEKENEQKLKESVFKNVCKNFMYKKCDRTNCKFIHDKNLCFYFWKFNECKFGDKCKNSHFIQESIKDNRKRKPKNTECFEPMTKPVDLRFIVDTNSTTFLTSITSRDVLVAPHVFSDFTNGELYNKLVNEIENCGIAPEKLLKLWHGNDKIEGTHLIADDKTYWKNMCPTFKFVIERLIHYFNMDVKATRLNWYKDTSQWKPFHFDSSAVNPDKAAVQNFTVAVSFGATRDAAFEHAKTKTVISSPQPDGCVYAFAKDTNLIWRHGILQDMPVRNEGSISIICWGWIDNQTQL